MTVIDLDLPTSPPATPAPPPVHRHRRLALVVAGLLALALGGATPATPALWRHVGSVPLSGEETVHAVAGERLFLTTVTGERPVTTAWQVDPPRRAWSVAMPDQPIGGPVPLGAGLLLQHLDLGVAVLEAGTGRVRWSSPVYVQQVSDRVGLSTETRFAPGTEYDEASGDPGLLYFSADGRPHTRPPRHTDLHGIDLTTGRRLWSDREKGAIYAVPAPGEAGSLVVVTADAVEVRDAATGTTLRRRALPPAGAGDAWYPQVARDVLLVRRGTTSTAYALDTLQPRWQTAEPPEDGGFPSCPDLLCRRGAGGAVGVLDPATGRVAWQAGESDAQLVTAGDEVLVTSPLSDRPQHLRDAATGAVRADLSRWDTLIDLAPDGELMVSRYDTAHRGRVFGIRPPGATAVRPIGAAPGLLRDCVRSPALVACRGTDRIEVFAYGAGR